MLKEYKEKIDNLNNNLDFKTATKKALFKTHKIYLYQSKVKDYIVNNEIVILKPTLISYHYGKKIFRFRLRYEIALQFFEEMQKVLEELKSSKKIIKEMRAIKNSVVAHLDKYSHNQNWRKFHNAYERF